MKKVFDFAQESDKRVLYEFLKTRKKVKYSVEIKQHRENRSIPQLRYYWGVVVALISEHTGFFPDEVHEVLKKKFNPKTRVLKQTGEEFLLGGSTSEMDTLDFTLYLEQVRIWASTELDILIPDPTQI